MSLSTCLRKAGESIAREDKVAILAKAKELRESGLENQTAARKAVLELLDGSRATLTKMQKDLGVADPAFARKERPEPREMPADHEVAIAPRLDAALRRWGKGETGERDLAAAIQRDQQIARERRELAAERDRARGPKWVQQRLLEAERHGEIPEETGEFARWLLQHSPHLAEDLALTVRERGGGARGVYNPAERLVTLFRSADVQTGVHEILHHTERMMPPEVQDGIRREWQEAVKARVQEVRESVLRRPTDLGRPEAARNQAYLRALDAMDAAASAGHGELARRLYQGQENSPLPPLRHLFPYELSSPSEFWAVNGARLMGDRYDARHTWVERARQWLYDLMQFVRSRVGLKSNAALLRGLESVISGDGTRVPRASMLENSTRPLHDEPSEPAFARKDGEPEEPAKPDATKTPEPQTEPTVRVERRSRPREIQVDGKWRPESNADGKLIYPTFKGQVEFWRGAHENVPLDAEGRPEISQKRAAALLFANRVLTADQIAADYRLSRSTIARWIVQEGVARSNREAQGVPESHVQTAVDMYAEGLSTHSIAKALGVGKTTVKSWVNDAGIMRTGSEARGGGDEKKATAVELYKTGLGAYEIARQLGVTSTAVSRWLKMAGVEIRSMSEAQSLRADQGRQSIRGVRSVIATKWGDIRADSVYEAARIKQLEKVDDVAKVERASMQIPWDEGRRRYTPDLLVTMKDGSKRVEEIKPHHQLENEDVVAKAEAARVFLASDDIDYRMVGSADLVDGFHLLAKEGGASFASDEDAQRFKTALATARSASKAAERDAANPSPDVRFARRGTTTATANLPASAPLGTWERSKSVVSDLIDEGLTKSGVYKFTSPMSEGSTRAKAIAQNFANAERQARAEWTRIQDVIAKDFPDKTVREKMWNAADEENEILSGRLSPGPTVGLASLTPRQRDVVEQLHAYGEELLQRAKDVGMFSGDGVPYWTPRMMVMLDANGDYVKPTEPGKKQTSGGDGRNVFTSSSNLKQRKYLTAADTEAAMQAKGGELVRDITTMPMAMQRLERAIAGRELINQVKDLGRATGTATVSNSMHEGFFTLDHAAFTRFQPRMEKDPVTGKSVAMQDSHGNIILDRVPLYMSKEFEGPIKAILSNTDGTAYRAYMLLKSKAMSAIMFSPAIHQMVIFGRALGYDPTLVGTVGLYFRGNAAKKDDTLVRAALDAGLVPMGGNHAGMIDITDVARGIGREGGLGDPNESWIAHGARVIIGAVNKDAGEAAKRFVDKAGEIWHGTLLWDRVGDLQMGIFDHAYERLQSEGFDPKVAAVMAAHWGNRYAGAVGRENMGEYARKAANVLLFSRSFNAGNWGTVKDMVYGMPAGLRAKIEFENGKAVASKAYTEARKKAISGFIADAALSLIALSLAQSAVDKLKKDKGWDEIFGGYMDRAGRMGEEIKQHPFTPKSYSPWQLSPTHDNEPGKQDRVDMGEIPGAGGRHEYMRLPTGKVVEDLVNWVSHPAETFSAKMSPLAKAAWQIISNDKGFGVPVYDEKDATFALDVARHLAKAQTPWDTIVTAWDKLHGRTTPIEDAKLLGNMTGFSASQGHPQGPEAGVAAELEERMRAKRLLATEEVKRLLKYDDEDKARQKLEDAGFTPREVTQIIKKIESPREGMSPTQRRKFNSHSSEEDQQRMERVTR